MFFQHQMFIYNLCNTSNMRKYLVVLLLISIVFCSSKISFGQNQTNSEIIELSTVGISLLQQGKFNDAIRYFDKILEIDPYDSIALGNKGAALTQLNRHEEALQVYNKALEIDPKNTSILNNKAATLFEIGRIDESLLALDKILEIEPENVSVLTLKGKVLTTAKRYEESFLIFKKSLEIDPKNEDAARQSYYAVNHIRLLPVTNSKYSGYVVLDVRNSEGGLVSVIVSDALGYMPLEITDEYLNDAPVKEKIVIDGKTYEKREFTNVLRSDKTTFIGRTFLVYDKLGYDIFAFDALPHGITLENGDTLTANWVIFREVS